jgi:hypothetical protein
VVDSKQPVPKVYLITEVPAETPVTIPVPAPIDAIPGESLLQVPPAVISLRVVSNPVQTSVVPVIKAGLGSTATVIVNAEPAHDPAADVGVTKYSTVPDMVLLGLVRIWFIVPPEPAPAPVILAAIVPIVHVKLLAALDVKVIAGPEPLQVTAVAPFVTAGVGFTVTVIVKADPVHDPTVEVGVTIYSTVPATELLGLVSTWLIAPPEPALAPVIPPEIVPIVHIKLPGTLDANVIFGLVPLQVLAVAGLVTMGVASTVTVVVSKHDVPKV